jgi:hypothetical protein
VITQTISRFPLQPTFFGLTPDYHENVYEQFFFLKYHGGWGLMEAYNLPVRLREWFVKRLLKQKNDEADEMKAASKGRSGKGGPATTLGPGNAPSAPVTR